MKNIGSHN